MLFCRCPQSAVILKRFFGAKDLPERLSLQSSGNGSHEKLRSMPKSLESAIQSDTFREILRAKEAL